MAHDDQRVIVDLVMASLKVCSTGVTLSGRPVIALTTPPYLHAREVLDKWVRKYIPDISFSDASSELKFLSLIACFSPLPRGIQLMVQVMMNRKNPQPIKLDAQAIRNLYSATINKVADFYTYLQNVKLLPLYGRALPFGETLQLDQYVVDLIAVGLFTNSVDKLSENTTIIPRTSIVAMNLLCRDFYFSETIRDTIDSLLDYLGDSGEQLKNSGRPLEIVMNGLINARLAVLVDIFTETRVEQQYTLFSLFQLQPN